MKLSGKAFLIFSSLVFNSCGNELHTSELNGTMINNDKYSDISNYSPPSNLDKHLQCDLEEYDSRLFQLNKKMRKYRSAAEIKFSSAASCEHALFSHLSLKSPV